MVSRNKQRGSLLYGLMIALIVGSWLLIRGNMALNYQMQQSKGKAIATDILFVVEAWSEAMDYRCVISDSSSIELSDLLLSDSVANSLPQFNITFTVPPLPSIEFTLNDYPHVVLASVVNHLEHSPIAKKLAPLIEISQSNILKIKATRYTSAAETGMMGKRSNGDAVVSSLMLGGIAKFGIDGC
ncbi:MAG: hypothetical protein V7749_00680 [Cocleimonas sp.]